jgi:hypothetical protein
VPQSPLLLLFVCFFSLFQIILLLVTLDLSNNELGGLLPPFQLVNLQNLQMSDCQLTGQIPEDVNALESLSKFLNCSVSGPYSS